jgi:hypothetical protein
MSGPASNARIERAARPSIKHRKHYITSRFGPGQLRPNHGCPRFAPLDLPQIMDVLDLSICRFASLDLPRSICLARFASLDLPRSICLARLASIWCLDIALTMRRVPMRSMPDAAGELARRDAGTVQLLKACVIEIDSITVLKHESGRLRRFRHTF